ARRPRLSALARRLRRRPAGGEGHMEARSRAEWIVVAVLAAAAWCAALGAAGCDAPAARPPSDEELQRLGAFDEPLLPAGATSADENRALASALAAWRSAARERDAVEPLLAFLDAYPDSAWAPSLRL